MPPAVVNGLMMSGAQLYSFFMSLFMTFLLGVKQMYGVTLFAVMFIVSATFTLCINEKKGRYEALMDYDRQTGTATNASIVEVSSNEDPGDMDDGSYNDKMEHT